MKIHKIFEDDNNNLELVQSLHFFQFIIRSEMQRESLLPSRVQYIWFPILTKLFMLFFKYVDYIGDITKY